MLALHSSLTELYRSAKFDACSFKYFVLVPLKLGLYLWYYCKIILTL